LALGSYLNIYLFFRFIEIFTRQSPAHEVEKLLYFTGYSDHLLLFEMPGLEIWPDILIKFLLGEKDEFVQELKEKSKVLHQPAV
jgi:hypothetical protein